MRKPLLAFCMLLFAVRASAAVPASERDALVALFQSTNGNSWTNKSGWNGQPGSECKWFGVTCNEAETNVVGLELGDNNLDGTLPPSIRNLTKLIFVYVYSNNLRGPLPAELGELSNLELLYGARNHFSGTLPAQLGNLKKLKALALDENELAGSIPPQLGDMTAMEELTLSNNQFVNAIPADLARLTNLKSLGLSVNQLSGKIPVALSTFPKLEVLSLYGNALDGAIPPELGNLATLQDLTLGFNHLSGNIPASLGKLRALERLHLVFNELSGPIPPELGDLAAIQQLLLGENNLSGKLPDSLFRLTTLVELNLSNDEFTGELSPEFGKLVNLENLALDQNHFTGNVPASLASLTKLRQLDLSINELSGPIPPQLGTMKTLAGLGLGSNDLTGTIPRELGSLSNLETLGLDGNELEGTIPAELGDLASLRILMLYHNHLRGGIPDALRKLTKLEQFSVADNEMSGPLPPWVGEWTKLTDFFVDGNRFSGTLPRGLETLENLAYMDVGQNELSGRLIDFSKLGNLVYLIIDGNHFSGPLPASIGALTKLDFAAWGHNDLTGPLPKEIGNLTNVTYFDLSDNDIDGPIPPEIGNLKKAYNLGLCCNHFSGALPKELGDLTTLQYLQVSFNNLRGAIPSELTRMTGLLDHSSDFTYNALYTNDERVRAFINLKQSGEEGFEATQTVLPTNIRLVDTTDRSATLAWTPIAYSYYGGGYQVAASTSPNGTPVVVATTNGKALDSITVRGLAPATTYFFTVTTVSHPISGQENLVLSERSSPIQGTTRQRVIAPADVVMTDAPSGLVMIDGVEVEADGMILTNFGDVATNVTLERNQDFFTVAPTQFALAAGASQRVILHATTQPVGTYYGSVSIRGTGVPDGLYADVVLLSSARPTGTVVATPLATRIERAGAPGSEEVGIAQFRNTGTAPLRGIVVSDQPWIVVPPEPITIEPGQIGSVNFRIVRSRRAVAEGGLVANLELIYVTGGDALKAHDIITHDTPGVSVSKVTIVDVTKPPVSTGPIPALGPGQLALFIPGIATSSSNHSDVSILNGAGAGSINDLKLYFTSGLTTNIASMQPLGFAQGVSLPNIVSSIYGGSNASGTLQIRSLQSSSLTSEAKVTAVTPSGTFTGSIPVFRGDRSVGANARLYLTGLSSPGDLLVQETSGGSTTVQIELRDASGNLVSSSSQAVGGYALYEVKNAFAPNVTTAVIRNGGPGFVTASARLRDANGDTWTVVDWSRFYAFNLGDAVRVPFADGAAQGGAKRRSVRTLATTTQASTDVVLYNPGTSEARATMSVVGASDRAIVVPAGATVTVANAGSSSTSPVANLVITPTAGQLAVSARTHHAGGGSAIPVLPKTGGLRLGQSQIFAGLDDSTAVRTSYGLTESSGATVKVRVSIIIDESNPLTATVTSRTFTLAPNEQTFLPELVRSFAGDQRDTLFGDLHNLTLEFEVTEGSGSVVPFLVVTDTASGDTNVVVQ